jgi:hypothetical protein
VEHLVEAGHPVAKLTDLAPVLVLYDLAVITYGRGSNTTTPLDDHVRSICILFQNSGSGFNVRRSTVWHLGITTDRPVARLFDCGRFQDNDRSESDLFIRMSFIA